jgi:23S rRNA pseudouridine955/2504/2580 synthase
MTTVPHSNTVASDEAGLRLDRWVKLHYPGVGFGQLQKWLRTGQVRVDGGRVKADARLAEGQVVRMPPMAPASAKPLTAATIRDRHDDDLLAAMLLYEDKKVLVFNKPAGLAVQGGSGISRHVDGMLESWRNQKGEKPRLVHRIDRDTSGLLVVARTRGAAVALTKAFRERDTSKIYWAICFGVPSKSHGRISTWLIREKTPDGDRMRVAKHGEAGADHAETQYRLIDAAGNVSWIEAQPITGRTHQLRVHLAHVGHPILGDSKYFNIANWQLPGGIQNRLHLHARHIDVPHPDGGRLKLTAPLPPHMVQTFNLLGFDEASEDANRAER